MAQDLTNIRVAVLVTDGFEEVELYEPVQALREVGAVPEVVAPAEERVRGWDRTDWGKDLDVDVPLDRAEAGRYDALLLPGGVMNPDHLRMNPVAVDFVRHFVKSGKPIASICHGPWTLIDAGAVSGKRMTSYPSLRTDLINAGAEWVDEEAVVDGPLVTSRKPGDVPAFIDKMMEIFSRVGAEARG